VANQPIADRLPRLGGLLMFEAAARHLSFTLAAQESARLGQAVKVRTE
jgi:DNA-binding transcriptional LysR family regulator